MGGAGGSIIVSDAVHATLTNPVVHGQLPEKTQQMVDPILAKDQSTWSTREKKDLGIALSWALQNLK
jgi:hypothetical protein